MLRKELPGRSPFNTMGAQFPEAEAELETEFIIFKSDFNAKIQKQQMSKSI